MLTRAEAEERWCPFARASDTYYQEDEDAPDTVFVANRGDDGEGHSCTTCLADRCMAWRWVGSPTIKVRNASDIALITEPPRPASVPASWLWQPADPARDHRACWVQPADEAALDRRGFCGLAGRPIA